jgi:hypothetical protein
VSVISNVPSAIRPARSENMDSTQALHFAIMVLGFVSCMMYCILHPVFRTNDSELAARHMSELSPIFYYAPLAALVALVTYGPKCYIPGRIISGLESLCLLLCAYYYAKALGSHRTFKQYLLYWGFPILLCLSVWYYRQFVFEHEPPQQRTYSYPPYDEDYGPR